MLIKRLRWGQGIFFLRMYFFSESLQIKAQNTLFGGLSEVSWIADGSPTGPYGIQSDRRAMRIDYSVEMLFCRLASQFRAIQVGE